MIKKQLFRTEALDKFSSPDQLDKLLQVTGPRDWLWLGGVLLLAAAMVLWGFLGELPHEAPAEGVIDHSRNVPNVITSSAGLIKEIRVKPGQQVAADQVAAVLYAPDGQLVQLRAPQASVVESIWVDTEMYVQPGTVLMELGLKHQPYYGDVYVSAAEARSIQPGMGVRCAPYTARTEAYGFALGRVLEVSPILSTEQEMEHVTRDREMVQRLRSRQMVHHVLFVLNQTTETESGLEWSGGHGPTWKLADFGRCRATILLNQQHPIELFLPALGVSEP